MESPIVQGRIVWATIPDSRGANPKNRPVIVLTDNDQIDPAGELQLVAITTLIGDAPFSETIELPWHPDGHSLTKLKRPSEAVCSWVGVAKFANVRDSGGSVPPLLLVKVIRKVRELNS